MSDLANDKITPGPWEVDQDWIDLVKAEHPDWGVVRIGNRSASGHIGIANAHLIAAAPDMLEALRRLIDWQDEITHAVPLIYLDAAKRAVAKAEGRS